MLVEHAHGHELRALARFQLLELHQPVFFRGFEERGRRFVEGFLMSIGVVASGEHGRPFVCQRLHWLYTCNRPDTLTLSGKRRVDVQTRGDRRSLPSQPQQIYLPLYSTSEPLARLDISVHLCTQTSCSQPEENALTTFVLFVPSLSADQLSRRRFKSVISTACVSAQGMIPAEETVEMFTALLTSPDGSMGLSEFEMIMHIAGCGNATVLSAIQNAQQWL
ncbi:hypothetical protein FIBSPDRAFT_56916 [Athelia psychrophila]|uniref:EF-hand domain-containing protein n=1 Tax=Athelia psychrophila TaxID=1759441 RepID=A0A166FBR2_9AGAM|nr:hypothetical protein FIBSPDRAFT_56916 [Fibularhizoctonia sp. CBS 109695]